MKLNNNHSQYVPLSIHLCLWLTVFLWSSALVGIRIGLQGGYTPGALGLFRYLVACFFLIFLYLKLPERKRPSFRDLMHLTFIGTVGIGIYNIAINYGELVVPAGIAGFILGLMPVFTMLFAIVLLQERVPVKSWFGVLIAFIGLGLIALNNRNHYQFDIGLLYIVIAAVFGSYYAVAQKTLFHRYHPLEMVILTIWSGTLIMLFFLPSLIREIPHASWQATAAAVYLGIFPAAIAYALWNFALARAPAGRASAYLYAMPIIATFLGMILLREYPTPLELTGGLITLLGAFAIHYFYNQKIK